MGASETRRSASGFFVGTSNHCLRVLPQCAVNSLPKRQLRRLRCGSTAPDATEDQKPLRWFSVQIHRLTILFVRSSE
jgi:hypothetical protein